MIKTEPLHTSAAPKEARCTRLGGVLRTIAFIAALLLVIAVIALWFVFIGVGQ